jgi:hypothetical protein
MFEKNSTGNSLRYLRNIAPTSGNVIYNASFVSSGNDLGFEQRPSGDAAAQRQYLQNFEKNQQAINTANLETSMNMEDFCKRNPNNRQCPRKQGWWESFTGGLLGAAAGTLIGGIPGGIAGYTAGSELFPGLVDDIKKQKRS